jgi:hypothetical protein
VDAAKKLLEVYEQVKLTWSQAQTVGWMERNIPCKCYTEVLCQMSLSFWMSPYSATREIISLAKNKHYDQHIFLL